MEELYYIRNVGCDDETRGIAIIPKEFFNIFKEIIENLNENSQYSCMPTIEVYRINKDMLREATDDDKSYNILHLGEKKYILKEPIYDYKTDNYIKGVEKVICEPCKTLDCEYNDDGFCRCCGDYKICT